MASGQLINKEKSSIHFGHRIVEAQRCRMRNILHINQDSGCSKYLGLPDSIGKRKSEIFNYIVERIKQRTENWSKKFLSNAGKEILLKSIGLSMPFYAMTCFKLTKGVCDDISRVVAQYRWSKRNTNPGRTMHWIAWNKLCSSKREGGLGFRDIERFNDALLAKQTWRVLKYPHSLLARTLRGRYYNSSSVLQAKEGTQPSYGWTSLLAGRNLLLQGLHCLIGDGNSTSLWKDPWLNTSPARPPRPRFDEIDPSLRVNHLINNLSNGWNQDILSELIHDEDMAIINSMKLPLTRALYCIRWMYTKDGEYSVKTGYHSSMNNVLTERSSENTQAIQIQGQLWKLNIMPRVKHFLWKSLNNTLPIKAELYRRHIAQDDRCASCGARESTNHLLFTCPSIAPLWTSIAIPNNPFSDPMTNVIDKLNHLLAYSKDSTNEEVTKTILWFLLWHIWKSRNKLIFQCKTTSPISVFQQASNDAENWIHINSSPAKTAKQPVKRLWQRPLQDWIKCNYDASFTNGDTNVHTGWLFRRHDGQFCGAGQSTGCKASSSLGAEMQGLLMAMQHAWCLGYKHVEFEGDNQELHNILGGQTTVFCLGNWIRNIITWSNKFEGIRYSWTSRQNNKPAHLLASNQIQKSSTFSSHYYVPYFLNHVLFEDNNVTVNI